MYGDGDNAAFDKDACDERLEFNQATLGLIREFSSSGSTQKFIDKVVTLIQQESGCMYIGIRVLDETGHIPYQSYVGFSHAFWEEENMIQVSHEDCSCTRIVSGNLLPCDKTIINEAGSLCLNDAIAFAETLSVDERSAYRGACVRWGYQSIAVIPIVYNNAIIGLFHLADPKPGQIRPAIVAFIESISPLVGEVLSKSKIESHLQLIETQRAMLESIVGGVGNLAYVVNLDDYALIYCQDKIVGPGMVGRKCYELFNLSKPCENCPRCCASNVASAEDHWERYDSLRDRYFFAERKNISWINGKIIRAAFVTDITTHRKTENALHDSINELQEISASLEEEIEERQAAQETLRRHTDEYRRKAMTDALTGLPNRACFNERLEAEMRKARQGEAAGSILFVDLDDLKMVNDTFGHKRGDALIISAAALIVSEVESGALVARVGGDEFIVLSKMRSRRELADAADRIIRALQYDYDILAMRLHTSASVGIAIFPDDGDTSEEIFKNADNAMYVAKRAGKNCWRFYDPSMQMETYEQIVLTSSLRFALEQGELSIMYQPQVSTKNHAVVGFEALLRWSSPQHGMIAPMRFIPLAEKSGLIHSIGQWVIREACQFAEKLNRNGLENVRVAVNVSPYQLASERFGNMVGETLECFRISPDQLEMEITESALIPSIDGTLRILHDINALGVRLALDDFGTGYSSLTYLHRLPVQTLKIDKSFIDMIITDNKPPVMMKNIVNMAHSMKMNVVAEGVETREQLNCLTKSRCDLIQGYFFSKPLPDQAAIQFLQEHA
ncbi:MAG TPA: EAL domain-containing protein [Patescibacteria group bacterium]|nr:EAL domain-containing protein [Patescibacteria group bacterium]